VSSSGEVCPHHIALTDESIRTFDTNFKMNPPFGARSATSTRLVEGVAGRYRHRAGQRSRAALQL